MAPCRFVLPLLALTGCPSDDAADTTDASPAETGTTGLGHTESETGPTDTDTGPCDPVTTFTAEIGNHDLELRFGVDVATPEDVWVACTCDTEPLEQHLVESSAPSTHHDLLLRGLLAGRTYTCRARSTCSAGDPLVADITTTVPTGVPVLTATHTPGLEMSGVYTMVNVQQNCGPNAEMYLVLLDPDGRYRWVYDVGRDLVLDIDFQLMGPDRIHLGGGWGTAERSQGNRGVWRDVDLSGNTLLERTAPSFGVGFNHHSEALADGTYLDLTYDTDSDGATTWLGVGASVWSPGGGDLWTWDSRALAQSGAVSPPSPTDPPFQPGPYHANAATVFDDQLGDALWLSIFGYKQVWRIDRTTGERTHVFGAGGDFTLVERQGIRLGDHEYPWIQHGIDYLPDGRMLMYDNGVGRPGGSFSRVVEYQLDLVSNQAVRLWSWTEEGWNDEVMGDADYLPNGNVLVTQAWSPCLEDHADVNEIVELRPPGTVVGRITWPDDSWGSYRSERYDGCAVFSNARYCPALAARWDELGVDAP